MSRARVPIHRVRSDLASSANNARYCVVVPHFNQSKQFAGFLPELMALNLSLVVIDDGSDAEHLLLLEQLLCAVGSVQFIKRPVNGGKGRAVADGARWAHKEGFTHILQIDADGQHGLSSVVDILQASRGAPLDLISGLPVFDDSVPAARLHGRKLSLWWARIETLSGEIKDVMCGFRIYPLAALLRVCDKKGLVWGMQFDIEVMVRLHWSGVRMQFVPVPVHYPDAGTSHFRVFRDNLRISIMHTRLFIGMLWRSPWLLARGIVRQARATALAGDQN
jgi:glycosyltransferase involved in cell wall biosynthesis